MSGTTAIPSIETTPHPIARFVGVGKSYDGRTEVVTNLNLDIEHGEFLTLLGPSGSGKTTTLMMLAGFETPSSGQILIGNRIANGIAPEHRNTGMVFQNYALFPHMTVAENVGFSLRVRGTPAAEKRGRVAQALEMVQLAHLAERRPSQLSGGQQQRVALARALIFEPAIVLLDEPLGALDKQLREQMQIEIKRLHERLGVAMVYVTHDQSEALTMSDRVAIFNTGKIEQIGSPLSLYEEPATVFAAQFIGESNSLRGIVRENRKGMCAVELPDGSKITARAADVEGAGARAVVSVRPERVRINPADTAGMNALSGTVTEVVYFGASSVARIRVSGCEEFSVIVHADSGLVVRPGDAVIVAWQSQSCRAFRPVDAA